MADEQVDITKAIETIDKAVSEKLDKKLDEKFHSLSESVTDVLDKKLDKISRSKEVEEEEPEDETEFVTKGDLKNFGKSIAEQVVKKTAKETNAILELKTQKQINDAEAFRTFPQLDPTSKEFDPKFKDAVIKEMDRRSPGGVTDHPDLVYDSAAVVFSKFLSKGLIVPKSFAERANQSRNNREDNFEIGGGSKGSSGPTQEQIELGMQYGMSKENAMKFIKKTQ